MDKNKKILVIYYSQTGQLKNLVDSVIGPLIDDDSIEITLEEISSVDKFDFPWPFFNFFGVFPECISLDAPGINQPKATIQKYDLIIFAYQPWFLSPSLPATGLLQSNFAKDVFQDTPVITLIGCRNMWLMAQEKVKGLLQQLKAIHIDNIVLIDQGGSLANFVTVTRWLLTGKKDALWRIFPKPGISDNDIKQASRFGNAIKDALAKDKEKEGRPLLRGYKAVDVDEKLIFSEKAGHRIFTIWAKIFRKIAPRKSKLRYPFLACFAIYLTLAIILIVPISMSIRIIISPITKNKTIKQKKYFEFPSGADGFNLADKNG